MLKGKIWATSPDGLIEYVSITPDLLKPSVKAMQESFYTNENVCVAFDMPNQPESFPEMDVLLLRSAMDGISIAAVEKASGKVVGAAFNKLERPEDSDFCSDFAKRCKHSASRGVAKWMSDIERAFDIFDHCKVSSVMEIMFLGVVPEFRKRGVAKTLCEASIELGRQFLRTPLEGESLDPKCPPPQLVMGVFTSFITQKIAKDLKFTVAKKIDFSEFVYEGRSLLIDNRSPHLTYEYLML